MIVVVGEQIVDRVVQADGSIIDRAGGAPANVAVALAHLRDDVAMRARISADRYGALLRERLTAAGVRTDLLVNAEGASSTALARPDSNGRARYEFSLDGTVDWQWTDAELHGTADGAEALVVGSLAMGTPPGCAAVERMVAESARVPVFYDPNLRTSLLRGDERTRVERQVLLADVVKASDEDLSFTHPGEDPVEVAGRWSAGGRLVVITRGADGSIALRDGDVVAEADALPVTVADTIGAGDAFLAGLVHVLTADGDITDALTFAACVAALCCTQVGAFAPQLDDVLELV
ncbi:MAG TPA: carbohydrate kinase [Mycobacteriales bacterium]|nr:carbohydrate kinase [Mycobacteriales bacterium]